MTPGRREEAQSPREVAGGGGSWRPEGGFGGAWRGALGPGHPVAGVRSRRPPAGQVIVRPGPRAPGRSPPTPASWRTALPPTRAAWVSGSGGYSSAEAAGLGATQPPSRARASRPVLGSLSWRSLCSPRGSRALRFCCAPGGSWLRHWARDAHGWVVEGGWPRVTGGGDGCEVSSCGWNRALRRTPFRGAGEPGRSRGRGQRRGRTGMPGWRVGEVEASELTSHQTVNLEEGVC